MYPISLSLHENFTDIGVSKVCVMMPFTIFSLKQCSCAWPTLIVPKPMKICFVFHKSIGQQKALLLVVSLHN